MPENVENLILEHLKKIQAEQSAARERDRDMLTRVAQIEAMSARIERIESRLEIGS